MVKVNSLEDEIEDKKRHVNLLKQELNDAVRREHEQVLITLFQIDGIFHKDILFIPSFGFVEVV